MRRSDIRADDPQDRGGIARHFRTLVDVDRSQIFGDTDSRCRPINLPADACTMFAGYVGPGYRAGRDLLFLAINPGGGGDAYTSRTAEDEIFYPLLSEFKTASSRETLLAFERINAAFQPIVKAWNLWRILEPTLAASGSTLDSVAYMNIVPYRTRGDKMPPVEARRRAWSLLTRPTLDVLRPRAIVTLGKKAGSVVDGLDVGGRRHYCVPRTIGDSWVSNDAREVHARMAQDLRAV